MSLAPAAGSPTLRQQEQQEPLDRAFAGLRWRCLSGDQGGAAMKVRDVASSAVVAVGSAQCSREATQLMAKHRVGSAVVGTPRC